MLNNLSIARLSDVHPELVRRVKNLADALAAEGIDVQITQGLRTAAQQDALFAEGRTQPGKIVTNARAYQSNHVIGCAVDVDVTGLDGTLDWNAADPSWQRIVALAPAFGLRSGKSWNDLPHLELQEVPTEPGENVQQACKLDGIQAAWAVLDIPLFSEA